MWATKEVNLAAKELGFIAAMHQQRLGGKGFVGLAEDSFGRPGRKPGEVAPWIQSPDGHIPFAPRGVLCLPAVGAGDAVMLTMVVPEGYDGVILRLHHNCAFGGFVDGSGDIVWRLTTDQRPIRNFDTMTSQYGNAANPIPVDGIRVYSGQTLRYLVNHIANAALNGDVVCSLGGYFYPRVPE